MGEGWCEQVQASHIEKYITCKLIPVVHGIQQVLDKCLLLLLGKQSGRHRRPLVKHKLLYCTTF